ncbi:RcnB family protein [Pseudoxanthomonas putridarboris]|uniref:RcnB family protein n=1 Tax=Pseudoxanthomonas putridarboris TaxID=752605 RepID=A0ABU9J4W9_9GAMM
MNRKRLLQSLACTVLAFAVTAPVLARENDRGWDRGRYDRRDDRHDRRDDRRDQRQAYRYGYHDGRRDNRYYDNRRYHAPPPPPRVVYRPAPQYHRWAVGQRYHDYYRGPVYVVNDYNHYHVRRPPRGYHWVRDDRGNLLMVAIATGIIADLLLHH